MVTKFGLFSHKIGHNSAWTISKAAEHEVFGHCQLYVVYKHLLCTFMIYNVMRTSIGLFWWSLVIVPDNYSCLVLFVIAALVSQPVSSSLHCRICILRYRRQSLVLRSSSRGDLIIPRSRLSRYTSRSFAVCGPAAWNSLPVAVRDLSSSASSFCSHHKPELFSRAYGVIPS